MKQAIRNIFRKILQIEIIWKFFYPLIRAGNFLKYQRAYYKIQKAREPFERLKKILQEPIVRNGPFKGMKYPDFISYGSAIFPKIIGSYESEISSIIEETCSRNYSEIIDIGCGEGFYAVGMAIRNVKSKIYAFDIDERARDCCRQMAELNNVSGRVIIASECSGDWISKFNFAQRGLIISDCEGAEKEIFDKQVVEKISEWDLIIEIHDFIDITISGYIKNIFSNTHHIIVIKSIDDITKAKTYCFQETKNLNLQTKKEIFAESRPAIMEWYYLKSKTQHNTIK